MPIPADAAALAEGVLAGRVPDVARAISWAESGDARFPSLLAAIFPTTGRARVTGLTGSPGAGKSTLTAALARRARARGRKVGIVAVDPSSPFSGGAILGDRIRMQDLYTDPGVLIRSMATRGHLGGLARATADAVDVLDAAGFDEVLVETVGVGQDEVEVFRLAESCVVVLTPGMGDDIQAIKAGLMEVADLFVVNKADRDGADRVVQEILQMLELGEHGAWIPPVVKTVATTGAGLDELEAKLGGAPGVSRRAGGRRGGSASGRGCESKGWSKKIFLEGWRARGATTGRSTKRRVAWKRGRKIRSRPPAAWSSRSTVAPRRRASPSSPSKKSFLLLPLLSRRSPISASPSRRSSRAGRSGTSSASSRSTARRSRRRRSSTSFRAGRGVAPRAPRADRRRTSPIAKALATRGPGHPPPVPRGDGRRRAALARLKAAGVRLVNEEPFDGAHGCLVAFVHPSATGGILLELSQRKRG